MFHLPRKSVLHALSVFLLLLGAANLFTLSIDDDDDEATPPIQVEMNFVASSKKAIVIQAARERARHHSHAAPVQLQYQHEDLNVVAYAPSLTANSASPQQVTPLRT